MKVSKGFSYSIESLIVIGLVLVSMVVLFSGNSPGSFTKDLKPLGADTLRALDEEGVLREYVVTNNTGALDTELSAILPQTLESEISICGETCPSVTLPRNKNVIASFYYLSGAPGNYTPYEIVLYLWEK